MTFDQGLAFGLITVTFAAFVWGRFRYDVVAVCALLAGVVLGVGAPLIAWIWPLTSATS